MAFPALLAPVLTWVFREVIIRFIIFGGVLIGLGLLVPKAIGYLGGFINPGGLTSAFGAVSPGVWYFLDFFQLGYGLPLVLSAYIARFLIRRLPLIG